MNVIVSNAQRNALSNLDIDVIKSISGEYEASELVEMFKNFFYNKMILDVTALKNFHNIKTFQTLAMGLDVEKIVFFLPEGSDVCTSSFLSRLISMGIYNFTTNLDGVKYLLDHPNNYKQVAKIQQMGVGSPPPNMSNDIVNTTSPSRVCRVIGVRNVTSHAGATTLIYMLKRELKIHYGDTIIAIELNKNDFQYFNEKNMMSVSTDQIAGLLSKYSAAPVILVDLNDCNDDSFCTDVLYLIEPSIIKLNRLMKKNRNIFNKLQQKTIILNKSLLTNKDIGDFEYEARTRVFYNMPPLDERKRNSILDDFLARMGLLVKKDNKKESNRIFGLFRR